MSHDDNNDNDLSTTHVFQSYSFQLSLVEVVINTPHPTPTRRPFPSFPPTLFGSLPSFYPFILISTLCSSPLLHLIIRSGCIKLRPIIRYFRVAVPPLSSSSVFPFSPLPSSFVPSIARAAISTVLSPASRRGGRSLVAWVEEACQVFKLYLLFASFIEIAQ